jgi:DNA-binding transcriptional LysR family regulator
MSDTMTMEGLPLVSRRVRHEAPNIDLVVATASPREVCRRIADDELDLAVGVIPAVPREFTTRELYRDRLVCLTDKRNPRLKNRRLNLKDYLESPHVTVAPGRDTGIQLDEILKALGISRRIAVTVPHYMAVPFLARGTDLVAHTAERLLSALEITSDLAVFRIPLPLQVPELIFNQVWHPRYEGDPGHGWFRDLVLLAL